MDESLEQQSIKQKKISFAQSEHIEAALVLLKECSHQEKLVGDNEFETLRNAVTMDAQGQMIINFLAAVDNIKKGSLH